MATSIPTSPPEALRRSIELTAPYRLAVRTTPAPTPRDDEAVVDVLETGLCGSDVTMYRGQHPVNQPPLVLGHEFYGRVTTDVADSAIGAGDIVAVFPALSCQACPACRAGRTNVCPHMGVIGAQRPGALAGTVAVPHRNIVPMPTSLPAQLRVLIEPMAVAVHAVRRCGDVTGHRCAVLGAGPIGTFVALLLHQHGAHEVLVVDPSEHRRNLVTAVRAGVAVPARPSLQETLDGRHGALDTVVDCVGSTALATQALAAVHPGGTVALVGIQSQAIEFDGVGLQRGERTVVGVQLYCLDDFHDAMRLLAEAPGIRDLPSAALINRNQAADAEAVFARLASGDSTYLKETLVFDPEEQR